MGLGGNGNAKQTLTLSRRAMEKMYRRILTLK